MNVQTKPQLIEEQEPIQNNDNCFYFLKYYCYQMTGVNEILLLLYTTRDAETALKPDFSML